MKKFLITLFLVTNICWAQSNWQVYQLPYDYEENIYTLCDNTGTRPFLEWWQLNIGIDYSNSSIPDVIKTGIQYAMEEWENDYFTITTGDDVVVVPKDDKLDSFFAFSPITTLNTTTGQISAAEIWVNTYPKYDYDHWNYLNGLDLIWNNNFVSEVDTIAQTVSIDARGCMTHELGHIWGIAHVKQVTSTPIPTMCSFTVCTAFGGNPSERMTVENSDWAALDFIYYYPELTSVTVAGNSILYSGMTGIWYVDRNEKGRPAFHYSWEIKYSDSGGYLESYVDVKKMKEKREKEKKGTGDIIIEVAPSEEWVPVGLDQDYFEKVHNPYDLRDFQLRCTVTDLYGSDPTSPAFSVDVVSYPATNIIQVDNSDLAKTGIELDEVNNDNMVGVDNVPYGFSLDQNYPNPFNPTTNISYTIPENGFVSLKVYDMLGKEVANLVHESKPAGNYSVSFDASNLPNGRQVLPSGVYIYTLQTNGQLFTRKMLLMK